MIDDPTHAAFDDYRHLASPDRRQKFEAELDICIGEGAMVVERLLSAGLAPRSVVVTPVRRAAMASALDPLDPDVVCVVTPEALSTAAGYHVHRGVLAAFDRPSPLDPASLLGTARTIAVVEHVNDFENLGALFRNAAAFGLDAVLLDPRCCDPFYRRCVRVSVGHSLLVPSARLAPWPGRLDDVRAAGFTVLAMTPAADAMPIGSAAAGLEKVAVLVGAEGPGLTDHAMAAADVRVRIPMAPGVDSLNVATAAAVAFHRVTDRDDGAISAGS